MLTVQVIFHSRLRYFLYRHVCDMRKGYDGLSGLVRNELKKDPLLGDVFIFFCRHFRKVKVLHWQGDGFAIYSKRLEKGTFEQLKNQGASVSVEITAEQLRFILDGVQLSSVKKRMRYEHAIV